LPACFAIHVTSRRVTRWSPVTSAQRTRTGVRVTRAVGTAVRGGRGDAVPVTTAVRVTGTVAVAVGTAVLVVTAPAPSPTMIVAACHGILGPGGGSGWSSQ
jgi:hypothetical protein